MLRPRAVALRAMSALLLLALAVGSAAAQEVTLPLASYQALRARALAEPPPPPEPPADLAFEEARLRVEVGATSARVVTDLTVFLFSETWQTLPLPALGTFIRADLGTLEGLLTADGEASLRLRGSGRHRLRLESVVPVVEDEAATRPTWAFELSLPRAAVVLGEVKVPPGIEDLRAEGGALILPAGAPGLWRLSGAPGSSVRLEAAAAAQGPERSELPLRFEATAATDLEISRARDTVEAFLEVRVRQGRLETLVVPIPSALDLVEVASPDSAGQGSAAAWDLVAGWDLVDGKAVIELARPVDDRLRLRLKLTGPPSQADLTSPLIQPEGAERTALFSRVSARGDGLLTLVDGGSGRRPDERQRGTLPREDRWATGQVLAVSRPQQPPRWQVLWAESTEVLAAQVDRLIVEVLPGEDGRALYRLWAEVRSTGAASLAIHPPPGLELVDSQRDGVAFTPGTQPAAEGGRVFVLPLRAAGGPQLLHLAGFMPLALPGGRGRWEIPLPSFSAPVSQVGVRVLMPYSHFAQLAEEGRGGKVGSLPSVPAAGSSASGAEASLARELFGRALESSGGVSLAESLLAQPPGFWALEAGWSALSANPSSLVLDVDERRQRKEWF